MDFISSTTAAIAQAVVASDELTLLQATARLEKNKPLADGVLGGLLLIFRDALCRRVGGGTPMSTAPALAETLASKLTTKQLLTLMTETQALQTMRDMNMNYTLFMTQLCARLRKAAGR